MQILGEALAACRSLTGHPGPPSLAKSTLSQPPSHVQGSGTICGRLSRVQQADQQVDEVFGGGVPPVEGQVAAELETGDAVGAGQEQPAVPHALVRPDNPGDDLEGQVLGTFGGSYGRRRVGSGRGEHEAVQVRAAACDLDQRDQRTAQRLLGGGVSIGDELL